MTTFPPLPTLPTWTEHAACAGSLDLFFPTNYTSPDADLARDICHGCPVRDECLAACMAVEGSRPAHARHGIYAGLDPAERAALYRARRRA